MASGSIRLFRVRGIELSVHVSFLLLLAYIAWDGARDGGWVGAAVNVVTLLVFFVCIVLHELGHAFMARRFGVQVPRIVLLPIGGMAQFTSMPRRPLHEILIAIAGPAVNYLIVALLAIWVPWPTWEQWRSLDLGPLQTLLVMNLTMGVFNLLPAFPMDGGRILRALLATRLPYVRATRWAANFGKLVAMLGFIYMVFERHNVLGGILFVFIIFAGDLEYRVVLRQDDEARRWRNADDTLRTLDNTRNQLEL